MGCGSVDLIDLFELSRGNLKPLRQRELQAHLAACASCSADYGRFQTLERALKAAGEETAVSLSPAELASLEVKLMGVASQYEPAKARKLWQAPAAKAQASRPRSARLRLRLPSLALLAILLLLAGGLVAYSASEGNLWKGLLSAAAWLWNSLAACLGWAD